MSFNRELYQEVDATGQGFAKIEPGIYICEILDPIDVEDKQLLKIKFDIVEGKYTNYYREQEKQFGEYPSDGYHYRSYKDNAMPFFKGFITAVEKSNANYSFEKTFDFKTLKGKRFAGIFEYEEIPFLDDDGNPIVKCRLSKVASMQKLSQGELKFSTDIKRLTDDQRKNINGGSIKTNTYTEDVIQQRLKEKEAKSAVKVSEADLPF